MILQKMAEMKFRGREVDALGFVDDLLTFCALGHSIEGRPPETDTIIVLDIDGSERVELQVEMAAYWKFRLICARLCGLSNEVNPELGIFTADSTIRFGEVDLVVKANNGTGDRFFSVKPIRKANHTSEGICQTADGLPKPSM